MNLVTTLSFVEGIDEKRIDDILFRVGTLSFLEDIGATKEATAKYFNISIRTLENYLKENKNEFRIYGKTVFQSKEFANEKFLGGKFSSKVRHLTLLNKKHILLLACLLFKTSETAKEVVKYLLELEGISDNDLKAEAIERSMKRITTRTDLKEKIEILQSKLTEAQPLIEFARAVEDLETELSIDEFCKSTFDIFNFGRNTLFQFMRKYKILDSKNNPRQSYVKKGYFKVKCRNLGGEIKCQPLLTGKGQLWIFNFIKKKMEVTDGKK